MASCPPITALQRTRLRAPLNLGPLGALPHSGRILGLTTAAIALLACVGHSRSPADAPKAAPPKRARALNLRRQPGGAYGPKDALNFWNLEVMPDGSAVLAAEGTPLIPDGNYAGVVSREFLGPLLALVDQLRSTPEAVRICMHASDFQVFILREAFRNACISEVSTSELSGLYVAAERVIREAPWTLTSVRPPSR